MQTNPPVQLEFTARFERDVRTLAKRYRAIRSDIQPLLDQLQAGKILLKASDRIVLITMYSKSDRSDVPATEVRDILTEYEERSTEPENESASDGD